MTNGEITIGQGKNTSVGMALGLRVGFFLVAIAVAAAAVSFVWTPYDVTAIDIASKLIPRPCSIRLARIISVGISCQ